MKELTGRDFWDWVDDIEKGSSPESYQYRQREQENTPDQVQVVARIKDPSPRWAARARKDRQSSPGWKGRARVQHRAGHIDRDELDRKLGKT